MLHHHLIISSAIASIRSIGIVHTSLPIDHQHCHHKHTYHWHHPLRTATRSSAAPSQAYVPSSLSMPRCPLQQPASVSSPASHSIHCSQYIVIGQNSRSPCYHLIPIISCHMVKVLAPIMKIKDNKFKIMPHDDCWWGEKLIPAFSIQKLWNYFDLDLSRQAFIIYYNQLSWRLSSQTKPWLYPFPWLHW